MASRTAAQGLQGRKKTAPGGAVLFLLEQSED
jgi:hypothetical protein